MKLLKLVPKLIIGIDDSHCINTVLFQSSYNVITIEL